MNGDATRFSELAHINESSGRMRSGENRYVLLDADALGKMRRELINNLGLEVARGIYERMGYHCGKASARNLLEHSPWSSEEEFLRNGAGLHCLEGMAETKIGKFEIGLAEGRLFISGDWLDSYEAEQHLKYYGVGKAPVCWILEGYATGYATEFFGREILCCETRCRGKGDPVCSFELRPAHEWGKAALPIQNLLTANPFMEGFDCCLHSLKEMGCELEQALLDAVITTDAKGIITSCSRGAAELLALRPAEAVGRNIGSFYGGGISEAAQIFTRIETGESLRSCFTDIITTEGRRVPISMSVSPIRDRMGDISGTICVAHDLTEIRRLEDELANKNRFIANILQDSADAIITLDSQDVITSWNRGAELIFGYAAGEAVGKPIDILIPADLREGRESARISEKIKAHGAVRSYQTERITKDGRRIQVIFTRTAIRDNQGNIIGSSAVLKDITFYETVEKQLVDAEHLATLGELSAGLAHEIKNPLAGIKGAIDVIRDSLPSSDMHRDILGDVLHEVNRIDKIVRDLLNYAKPKPPTLSEIDLPETAHRMVAMARKSSQNDAHFIEVLQLTTIPKFTGDETQLEQVLLNLLLNSQNAMPSGGHIQVRLAYDDEAYTIRMDVQDDGPGIPEEIRRRVFQPFFTTRTDGTGLGLATCLKNVQYHGGSIDLHSEVGRGTTFTISLPLLCRI
jgi:PAS domain S-box-containing protein